MLILYYSIIMYKRVITSLVLSFNLCANANANGSTFNHYRTIPSFDSVTSGQAIPPLPIDQPDEQIIKRDGKWISIKPKKHIDQNNIVNNKIIKKHCLCRPK